MPFGNPFGYGTSKRVDQYGMPMAATTGPGSGRAPINSMTQQESPLPSLRPGDDIAEFFRRNRSRTARMASFAAGGMAGLPSFTRTGLPFASSSMRSF